MVTLVALEALRMTGPLLDSVVSDHGVLAAAGVALITYVCPALLGILVSVAGARKAVALAVIGLVASRLAAQAMGTPNLWVAGAVAVVALGAVVLVTHLTAFAPGGAVPAVTGLVLGGAADVALRALLGTWDPVWQPGVVGWIVVAAECVALIYALGEHHQLHPDPYPVGRVGAVGGYLALWLLILGSPGFLASASGLSLAYATAALLVGALFAVEALSRSALPGGSGRWTDLSGRWAGGFAAGMLTIGVAGALLSTGIAALIAILIGQVGAALTLARVLTPAKPASWARGRFSDPAEQRAAEQLELSEEEFEATAAATSDAMGSKLRFRPRSGLGGGFATAGLAAGLCYVLVTLLYQVHYEMPLPFPNWLIPIGAAVLLGVLGLGERPFSPPGGTAAPSDERAAKRGRLAPLAVLPAMLLLAPVVVLVTTPAPARESAPAPAATYRLVSWNLHYAANRAGAIDPESIALAIEKQRADVVMLQEVSRGWPIGGGLDGAEWLSRRLGMPYVWAPAADGQFGNLILSRLRIVNGSTHLLPRGEGSMNRSYAAATVELSSGRKARLVNVHLTHRESDTATRLAQIKALLKANSRSGPTVIAGDFNSVPGSEEIALLRDAGLVSAQDNTGNGDLLTSPTDRPQHRVDWIFGTPDVHFDDFARPRVTASDHFPLAVTARLG